MAKRIRATKSQYLDAVRAKLRAPEIIQMLTYGPMDPNNSVPLRNEQGLAECFSNILSTAEKHYEMRKGRDAVANMLSNFSNAGYADVSNISTVGAIDVTILTLANSLIPFVAMDRAMNEPKAVIYYNDIEAINSAGGLTAGQIALGNFTPPNSNVVLGPANKVLGPTVGTGAAVSHNFGARLVPGNVTVTLVISSVTKIGKDYNRDGVVVFSGVAATVTVDYTTGVVSISTLAVADTATSVVLLDVEGDVTGANILKVKSKWTDTMLETFPKNIIFEQNEHSNAYMNKILERAQSVTGMSYANLQFQRLSNIYIEDLNRDILKLVVTGAAADGTPETLNLSTYGVGTFAETKNDLVTRFFIGMRTKFLAATGVAPTCCVVGSRGAAELESHPTKFVKSPSYYTMLNGFVGTFDGMPIYRHNYLDTIEGGSTATFRMTAKLPDNSSGSIAFGEFLPLTSAGQVGNFDNPMQNSNGYFSQVGSKTVTPVLFKRGVITY